MDQKNTIVKCARHNCLFNHKGVCDNYVINIRADGSCQEYVETESNEEFIELEGLNYQKVKFNRKLFQLCAKCIHSLTPAEYEFSPACCFSEDGSIRLSGNCPYASQELSGQHAKCENYIETEWLEQNKEYYDSCFYCQHALHEKNNKWIYCEIDGLKIDLALRSNQCKQFQSVYSRGQRAKGNFFEDAEIDPEIVKEVCKPFTIDDIMDVNDKHLGEPAIIKIPDPKDMDIHFTIQNAQVNIRNLVPECDLPVCDWSCKHALRTGPTFNPELWCDKMKGKPAKGLFCSDYEEGKNEV